MLSKYQIKPPQAFNELKVAMVRQSQHLPNFGKTFVTEADASGVEIGPVLMQYRCPLAYTSKAISPSHLKMTIYDKEMLAIVHAVTKWGPYLIGRCFQIKTDNKSLKYFLK